MNKQQEYWLLQKLIDNAIEEWIRQSGRTDEMIYGVKNFMTGRGLKMAKEIFDVGMSAQESIEKLTKDSIRTETLQAIKDKMPKEKETITVVYYANGLPNPDKSILLKENIGFNEYRSQMLEIIKELNK